MINNPVKSSNARENRYDFKQHLNLYVNKYLNRYVHIQHTGSLFNNNKTFKNQALH